MTRTFATFLLSGFLGVYMAVCPSKAAAHRRTVIENIIVAENPCAGLKIQEFGVSLGVDQLKDVTLDAADLSLNGDALHLSASGSLACRTSDSAAIKGDASASIRAEAALSLAQCSVEDISIRLSNFEGTFGKALDLFSSNIEQALRATAADKLVGLCQQIRVENPR